MKGGPERRADGPGCVFGRANWGWQVFVLSGALVQLLCDVVCMEVHRACEGSQQSMTALKILSLERSRSLDRLSGDIRCCACNVQS